MKPLRNQTIRRALLAFACTFIFGAVQAGQAAACNQAAINQSQADRDWWAVHGCQSAFIQWQYRAYDMDSGWRGTAFGWTDACNQLKDFPKFWSASYLTTYGLADDYANAFHFASGDYRPTAEAPSSRYHNAHEYQPPTTDTTIFGSWTWDPFGSNDVTLSCLLFDVRAASINANPASRAGDFMHEAWHGWNDLNRINRGPVAGHYASQGNCTINACDYFYFHGVAAYEPGALWQTTRTAARLHSPNQVQVEFLCDIADYPARNVPASVRQMARADANQRASQRFINGPGYSCGTPRPW